MLLKVVQITMVQNMQEKKISAAINSSKKSLLTRRKLIAAERDIFNTYSTPSPASLVVSFLHLHFLNPFQSTLSSN
jgi:hypothetical protein